MVHRWLLESPVLIVFQALKKASQEVAADEAEFDEEIKPDDGLG